MSCGKTAGYPIGFPPPPRTGDYRPSSPPKGTGDRLGGGDDMRHKVAESVSDGFLQTMSPETDFDREELQDIRDRAKELALYMDSGAERDTLDSLARAADILDALYAREEADMLELNAERVPCPLSALTDASATALPVALSSPTST